MTAIRRFCALATAFGALVAAAPAMAAPTTYCVAKQSCEDAGGLHEPTLESALSDAGAGSGTDRIEMGPGEFHRAGGWSFNTASAQNAVHIVGAGAGQTVLVNDKHSNSTTLTLSGHPKSSVSELTIVQSTGVFPQDTLIGLDLAGTARHVDVVGTCWGAPVKLEAGGSFQESHAGADASCTAVVADGSQTTVAGSVIDVTAATGTGIGHPGNGTLNVTHTRIDASRALYAGGRGTVNVDNSLMLGDLTGVTVTAQSGSLAVHLGHVTIAGHGAPGSQGIAVDTAIAGDTATVQLENSIVSGYEQALNTDPVPGSGTGVNVRYSNLAGIVVKNGGAIDTSDHVQHLDPRFVDAVGGDYRLRADSPLVDAGTTDLHVPPSDSDFSGAPRAVGPLDIGALELQPHAPTAVIDGPDSATVGQQVAFGSDGSSDPDPGDALTVHWTLDGTSADGAAVTHTFGSPGKASVELTVKDLGGHTSTVSKVVDVQPAPVVAVPGGAAPVVRSFSITKKRVALKAHRPAAFRFKLSKDARVRISLSQLGKKGRAARKAGALTRSAHAGSNRLAFSGRVGRRALKAGGYRATIVASDAEGRRSKSRSVKFTVRAR